MESGLSISEFIRTKWGQWAIYRVFIGCMLMSLPNGCIYYYGNLITYTSSYFRFTQGSSIEEIDPEWMQSAFMACIGIGVFMASIIARFGFDLINATALSAFIFDVSVFLTFYSVKYSMMLTIITSMIITGLTAGSILSMAIAIGKDWFSESKHIGLVISSLPLTISLGGIFLNPAITNFINPRNLSPDLFEGGMVYFTQREILKNYPLVYFMLAGISIGIHLLGLFCLLDTNKYKHDWIMRENLSKLLSVEDDSSRGSKDKSDSYEDISVIKDYKNPDKRSRNVRKTNNSMNNEAENKANNYQTFTSEDKNSSMNGVPAENSYSVGGVMVSQQFNQCIEKTIDFSPIQVLHSLNFYIMWPLVALYTFAFLIVSSFYKTFGQLYIEDDEFVSSIGSFSIISVTIIRFITGYAIDRWGLKPTIVFNTAMASIMMASWFNSILANRYVYILVTSLLLGFTSSVFSFLPASAQILFGPTLFTSHYAMLMTGSIFPCAMAAPIFSTILSNFTHPWAMMFFSTAILLLIILILFILFLNELR